MIPFQEVQRRARRQNHEENVWVHPFSGRISTWFTWAFVNLGLSANQVTFLFWLCGAGAVAALAANTALGAFLAFVLFRLHVLFDVCDGEVARFRRSVSRYGVYWDQVIHVTTYPALLAAIVWARLQDGAPQAVVLAGFLGMIGKTLDLAVKNLHYRVLWQAGETQAAASPTAAPAAGGRRGLLRRFLGEAVRLANYDAFLFFYAAAWLAPWEWRGIGARDGVLFLYALVFTAIGLLRMVSIPRRGGIPQRRDFYGD